MYYVHTIVLTEVSVGRVAFMHLSCFGVFSVVLWCSNHTSQRQAMLVGLYSFGVVMILSSLSYSCLQMSQALRVYPEMFWWLEPFLRNVEANLLAYALCPISLLVCSSTGFTNRMLCSHAGREWINIWNEVPVFIPMLFPFCEALRCLDIYPYFKRKT